MIFQKRIHLILILSLFATTLFSQEHTHSHNHLQNEIGLNVGATYSPHHKEWGLGTHVHYFRSLGLHSKWALGGSLEEVWADGNHYNISAGVKYQVIDRLNIGVMPGVTFLNHKEDDHDGEHTGESSGYKAQFAMHTEIVYDLLHFDKFHLGPAFDYSWTKHDSHFMVGVHAACCF